MAMFACRGRGCRAAFQEWLDREDTPLVQWEILSGLVIAISCGLAGIICSLLAIFSCDMFSTTLDPTAIVTQTDTTSADHYGVSVGLFRFTIYNEGSSFAFADSPQCTLYSDSDLFPANDQLFVAQVCAVLSPILAAVGCMAAVLDMCNIANPRGLWVMMLVSVLAYLCQLVAYLAAKNGDFCHEECQISTGGWLAMGGAAMYVLELVVCTLVVRHILLLQCHTSQRQRNEKAKNTRMLKSTASDEEAPTVENSSQATPSGTVSSSNLDTSGLCVPDGDVSITSSKIYLPDDHSFVSSKFSNCGDSVDSPNLPFDEVWKGWEDMSEAPTTDTTSSDLPGVQTDEVKDNGHDDVISQLSRVTVAAALLDVTAAKDNVPQSDEAIPEDDPSLSDEHVLVDETPLEEDMDPSQNNPDQAVAITAQDAPAPADTTESDPKSDEVVVVDSMALSGTVAHLDNPPVREETAPTNGGLPIGENIRSETVDMITQAEDSPLPLNCGIVRDSQSISEGDRDEDHQQMHGPVPVDTAPYAEEDTPVDAMELPEFVPVQNSLLQDCIVPPPHTDEDTPADVMELPEFAPVEFSQLEEYVVPADTTQPSD